MELTDVDLLESVLAKTGAIIAGVEPEQARLPSPCEEMDVTRLVDHLVGWAAAFAARVNGEPLEGDPNALVAGADPAGEFSVAACGLVSAYRADRPDARSLPVGMLLMEYLGHGWDLATATAQPTGFTAAEASRALELGRTMLKPEYRGPGKTFGLELPSADTDPPIDQLVAFLGRSPGWRPAGAR
jgi:uncharacterized protein (TIGR03086 family)